MPGTLTSTILHLRCSLNLTLQHTMEIPTPDESETVADSALKIQAVQKSLSRTGVGKILSMKEITECLRKIAGSLRAAPGRARRVRPHSPFGFTRAGRRT
jgi:hypothetical protein